MQAKQAEFELRYAKLRAEQRRQEILATSSFKEDSWISYKSRFSSKNSFSDTGPYVAAIFGRNKKVDNQVAASQTGETDVGLGAAGGASHTLEPWRVVAWGKPRCLHLGAVKQLLLIFLTQLLNQEIVHCLLL